jgi:hypothetical protein
MLRIVAALMLALPLASLSAQQESEKSDLLVRIHGPVVINPGDTVGTVWVINSDVKVMGSVQELIVMNGTAHISGTVRGSVFLFGSSGVLASGAHVGKDVLLYRSTIDGTSGAVAGTVHREGGASLNAQALWMLWLSITIALIATGMVFGYFFGDSFASVADQVRNNWRGIFLVTLVMVCGLPLAAVLSFMTGVGFVLGLFIMFALIPALSLLGYVVAGTSIGRALLQVPETSRMKMFGSIAVGIVVIQLMAIIPAIGAISVLLGSWFGAGALVHSALQRGKRALPAGNLITQPA